MSNSSAVDGKTVFDVVILGAGASGLFCAKTASARGLRVALVDHNATPGRKIAVSGGGKANFTNVHMDARHYVGTDPDFCDAALSLFSPQQILSVLVEHRLAWEEREYGRLFGLEKADALVDALLKDCRELCRFFLEWEVQDIEKKEENFSVRLRSTRLTHKTDAEVMLKGRSLVLALGSPAWSQVGASHAGIRWAKHFGHAVHSFRPVLVPLRMPEEWPLRHLTGISCKATLCTQHGGEVYACTDDLLFTHSGISGPAALQLSCRWRQGQEVTIDFLPHTRFDALLDADGSGKLLPRTLLSRRLPQRLADALLPEELARRKAAELSRAARTLLRDSVHAHTVTPVGCEGLRRAEAAAGGVSTAQINAWSMESLLVPGLFVTGELLDVTGHLGGYNLHWAWASGYTAGMNV